MKGKMKEKKIAFRVVWHIFMIISGVLMMYPLIWMVSSSLKPTEDVMRTAEQIFGFKPTFENYVYGWKGFARYTFGHFFKNSLFLAINSSIGSVISNSLIAYGFARIKFVGRKFWFATMIATMMLPGMVLQVPNYLMWNGLNMVGTFVPLLVPSWLGSSFYIFLMIQFMRNIPKEMDEAAEIDGCGKFQLFRHIMLPLIKPALAFVIVKCFMEQWGDYYGALIYLNESKYYPHGYALMLYVDDLQTNYGPMLAMSVVGLIPILILFFCFQRQLVEGISVSGLKG